MDNEEYGQNSRAFPALTDFHRPHKSYASPQFVESTTGLRGLTTLTIHGLMLYARDEENNLDHNPCESVSQGKRNNGMF